MARSDAALDRGARLGVARADTAVASAALITARALPNPSLNASYSKSVPNYHVSVDIPIDFPMLRQTARSLGAAWGCRRRSCAISSLAR